MDAPSKSVTLDVTHVTFQAEHPKGIWDELEPLLERNRIELLEWWHKLPIRINRILYEALADAQTLRVHTIRNAGALIGYCAMIVSESPRHVGLGLQALEDVLWLAPEYRGFIGRRFIDWQDRQLRSDGAVIVYRSTKTIQDHGLILRRIGYKKIDELYGLILNKSALEPKE